MKNLVLTLVFIASFAFAFSQDRHHPIEVTPAIDKKIQQEVAIEVLKFKAKLTDLKEAAISIEFAIDTFQIEKYQQKYIDYDWTTAGMRHSTYVAAEKYESILNKYYKKLLNALTPNDKAVLINAQKSWIMFRDNELKLVDSISKDEYSGGGTIQQLFNASEYLNLIKQRTITLFNYFLRTTQSN